jgi:uncharacterized membrane protein (UPF0127 family)
VVLPHVQLGIGFYAIDAEVASTPGSRQKGLMGRRQLAAHQGMLFIFPQVARHCMWMKNTLLPLSVAFIDETGHIINIEEMRPQSENNHCAAAPARYALEMRAQWFSQKGIRVGERLVMPTRLAFPPF